MISSILHWLPFIVLGAFSGTLSGLLGIGAGIVLVPALTYLMADLALPHTLALQSAMATTLAIMSVTTFSGVLQRYRRKHIDWSVVRQLSLWLLIGMSFGRVLSEQLNINMLSGLLGALIFWQAGMMLFNRQLSFGQVTALKLKGLGLLVGVITGLLGVGGGLLMVPALLGIGLSVTQATGTSLACAWPVVTWGALLSIFQGQAEMAGLSGYWGYVHLSSWLAVGLTGMLTTQFGGYLAERWPVKTVKRVFALLLIGVAIRLWIDF